MKPTTASVKRDQELMRLEVELRNFERSALNTIARMRRRMERIKQYGKEEKESKQTVEQPKVYCGECRHFVRDTSGPSFSIDTGEYFMGECAEGLHPDTPKKQFADKARKCETYKNK